MGVLYLFIINMNTETEHKVWLHQNMSQFSYIISLVLRRYYMIITFLISNANLNVNYEKTFVYLTWFFSVANMQTKIKLLRSIETAFNKRT